MLIFHDWLTKHSNHSACFQDTLSVAGYTLVQTLIIFLDPLNDQGTVLAQCDTWNAQTIS